MLEMAQKHPQHHCLELQPCDLRRLAKKPGAGKKILGHLHGEARKKGCSRREGWEGDRGLLRCERVPLVLRGALHGCKPQRHLALLEDPLVLDFSRLHIQ